ncbi:sigma 54-interacting transcriptional regulator [Acetonema longum]|uniref:HTH-type transcriptional regulatory protein TyrR n=1 Tax=Acetonema longum DSM 6540 TaxID=1009370 RepID=F7NI53_9FIRM|nr:sigma 54-interacting transcriptional regulator [Acetonema longum]EGO64285.1 putative PAS/PAC sensor protein [Acetonema longum DSM 6540]
MNSIRLKISNVDRMGLVLDISRVVAAHQANISSMEVELNTVYLEIGQLLPAEKAEIIQSLAAIPQVTVVTEINLMPYQERTEQIRAVMASVSDGIIAIDCQARITHYNPAAERIVRIPGEQVLGQPLISFFPPDMPLLEALHFGAVYNNREIVLKKTNSHYLASGRPILDQSGRIIGAVAILKDISDVRDLVYTVTGQLTMSFHSLTYASESMQRLVATARTVAKGSSTVLIRGETGTGKELLAKAIHLESARTDQLFVPINCAAIPDTLLESELFGYEAGAFTGANKGGKQGLFEFAHGGTIFLDEIGELSTQLQAKLLRVLQDGHIRRIGGMREIPVDVRILAATNRNLEAMIAERKYREDLYYRLNVIPLVIPPLRDRKDDIPLLARMFLQRFAAKMQKNINTISETALYKLNHYYWPGNVRELENVMERCANMIRGSMVLAEHISFGSACTLPDPDNPKTLRGLSQTVEDAEREVLTAALRQYATSRQLGAALGLSHTAVLKKLQKYGLKLPPRPPMQPNRKDKS